MGLLLLEVGVYFDGLITVYVLMNDVICLLIRITEAVQFKALSFVAEEAFMVLVLLVEDLWLVLYVINPGIFFPGSWIFIALNI